MGLLLLLDGIFPGEKFAIAGLYALFEYFGSLDSGLDFDIGIFLCNLFFESGKFGFEYLIFWFGLVDLFDFTGVVAEFAFIFFIGVVNGERLWFLGGVIEGGCTSCFQVDSELVV